MGIHKHGSDWVSRSYSRGSKHKTSDAAEAHNQVEYALDEVQGKIQDTVMDDIDQSEYDKG